MSCAKKSTRRPTWRSPHPSSIRKDRSRQLGARLLRNGLLLFGTKSASEAGPSGYQDGFSCAG